MQCWLCVAALVVATQGWASSGPLSTKAGPVARTTSMAIGSSGAVLRLNRLFYASGDTVSARLIIDAGAVGGATVPIVLVAPTTGDLEVESLAAVRAGREYVASAPVKLTIGSTGKGAKQLDGALTAKPGELIFALYYPDYAKQPRPLGDARVVFDYAVVEDQAAPVPPPQVVPELAMTEDETKPPPGGKRIGTIVERGGLPVQLPVNELIVYPTSKAQLDRLLAESGGKVVATDVLPGGEKKNTPSAYLIRLDPGRADLKHFPQMQALMGLQAQLYGSSEDVLRLVALSMQYRMEGYLVSVNPRLQFAGAPSVTESPSYTEGLEFTQQEFHVNHAWALTAVLDRDEPADIVNVAFLDMGFAPNPDFRGYPNDIVECDMEGASLAEGVLRGFTCGPHVAEGPPTVGNSLLGPPSWHGTMVVSTAGAVLNNGYGVNGVAGQVLKPMLYRFGLASYAFEIGLGIQKAVMDGASVVNISAGYPCQLLTSLGSVGVCNPLERGALCAAVTAGLTAAAVTVCATAAALSGIPIIGPILAAPVFAACGTATAAAVAASGACFATLAAGDVRGTMAQGVEFATAHGVPVVSISGNRIIVASLPPVLAGIINTTDIDESHWQIVPCVIPGVICAGSADDGAPHNNQHFLGPDVDIWAPDNPRYFAPPDPPTALVGPTMQVGHYIDGGGTSSAAGYISGTVALVQALNPDLDPHRTTRTGADLRRIPADLLQILQSEAWTTATLPTLPSNVTWLVDPDSAAQEGARRAGIDAWLRGYDRSFDFDEATPPTGDSPATRFDLGVLPGTLGFARPLRGTIHYIPAVPSGLPGFSGVTSTDQDWFRFAMPDASGLYVAHLSVRMPAGFGRLAVDGDVVSAPSVLPVLMTGEETLESRTPSMFGGTEGLFELRSNLSGSDNVYIVSAWAERVGDVSTADRFDVNDPLVNPPESRPNNDDRRRAVHLGETRLDAFGSQFVWARVDSTSIPVYEIRIPGLNFHTAADVDWFAVTALPPSNSYEPPGCQPRLRIDAGPRVHVAVYSGVDASSPGVLLVEGVSPLEVPGSFLARLPVHIVLTPEVEGAFVAYDLALRFTAPPDFICRFERASGQPDGGLDGSQWEDFPRFLPELVSLEGTPFEQIIQRATDPDGRITTPDDYVLRWKGGGTFRLVAELQKGASITLSLVDATGKVVASSVTPGLSPGPDHPGWRGALLESKGLPAGDYLLKVSHGTVGTRLRILLPKGAIRNGSTSVEERFDVPQLARAYRKPK